LQINKKIPKELKLMHSSDGLMKLILMLKLNKKKNFHGEKELFKKLRKLLLKPQILMNKSKNIKDFTMKPKKELKEFLMPGKTSFQVLISRLNSLTMPLKLL